MAGDYGDRTRLQTAWLAGAARLLGVLLVGGGWLVLARHHRSTASPVPTGRPPARRSRRPVTWARRAGVRRRGAVGVRARSGRCRGRG
jgi:hypothetical protein